MSLTRRWLYFRNRSEPLRQATLLLLLSGAAGRGENLLQIIKAQSRATRGEWSAQLSQLAALLESGHPLTTALALTEDLLPPGITAAISAAESTGCLPAVMRDEADRLITRMNAGTGHIQGLMVTACGTLTVFFPLATFLMVFCIPKLASVFEGFGLQLPAITLSLLDTADFIGNYWYYLVLPLVCGSGWGAWYQWRDARHRQIHGSPLLAGLSPRHWVPGLLRMFSISAAAGKPLTLCMNAAIQQLPAGRAADRMLKLRELLERGEPVPAALERTRLLSRRDAAFLRSATTAGHPDWALRQLAEHLDNRRAQRQQRHSLIIACSLQIFVGLIVLWFSLAFFMPLVKLISVYE